jgi:hypothetical protein
MATKLGSLLSALKKAVVDAQRSVSNQHIDDLQRFFKPAEGQADDVTFPNGRWEAQTVIFNVPKEVSRNGVVSLENHPVSVPLITLVPQQSHVIDRVEILTTVDMSLAGLESDAAQGQADLPDDVLVQLGNKIANPTEIKIVIQGTEPPEGYARVVGAYAKVLNAQIPM